jgi:arylsulfatase
MVIHWPAGIKARGEIREQFGHVIDIAPTIYEASGIPAPRSVNGIVQDPIEGTSLLYSFNDAKAPEKHSLQYFEMFGNRAIYQDGWFARAIHRAPYLGKPYQSLQEDPWELYDTKADFSLSNNLATREPEKLKAMQAAFMKEAEKFHVLPLDDRTFERMSATAMGRPAIMEGRNSIIYGEGMKGMAIDVFIDLRSTSYTITADVELVSNANGVLVCQGGRFGGLSFYIKKGKPAFTYNFLGLNSTTIMASQPLKPGKYSIVYDFKYDGGGRGKGGVGTIMVNGLKVSEGRLEKTQPGIFSVDDLADIGIDEGTQVADYNGSSKFNGKIKTLKIETRRS